MIDSSTIVDDGYLRIYAKSKDARLLRYYLTLVRFLVWVWFEFWR